jgi:nucleoside-diphosphate-sugar epimerase
VVTEDSPILPDDEYGLSKWLGEELARYHARRQDLATVALRLGMFVPETFERYGFRLLFGGVDDRDVAQAVLLALEHEPAGGFEAVDVMAEVPFQPADAVGLHADPAAVLERYWPGCTALFADRGLELEELVWGRLIWPIDKARGVLGYRPGHNFGEFLAALRAGDTGYYPFANLPWWGV